MSKWNRKIWAAILAVGMTASLTACGGSKGENSNASAAGTQNETATVQDESADSNTDSTGSTTALVQDNRVLQIPDDNYRTTMSFSYIPSMTATVMALEIYRAYWKSWIT